MKCIPPVFRPAPLLALALLCPAHAADPSADTGIEMAAAKTDENTVELETVVVSGTRGTLSDSLPATTAGVTATELRERVFINTEDALRNLPNVSIRKRYVGDRNALIGGRSHGTLQAPRGVVYADGVLLSNFLGRFNAPRWNMVAPEEISRVDVVYGPFSALYPGNSIGTTVLITTRDPDQLSASGRMQYFTQTYKDYGYEDDYAGRQYSLFGGDRWGDWSGTLGVNRLQNKSQPMQYATGTRISAPTEAESSSAVDVTGALADLDPRNQARLILGPDGGAIEDDEQDQVKAKLAYENPLFRADAQFGYWRNDYERHGVSFLRDAAGNTVSRGLIRYQDQVYSVANSAFGPQDGVEEHLMYALTARTKRDSGWNASTVVSLYDIAEDELHASVPASAGSLAGTITDGAGTGWWNVDVQASYRSDGLPHTLTVGYYHSRYDLESEKFNAADWRSDLRGSLSEASFGSTLTQALYAQDAWRFAPGWTATAGVRLERWQAYDGERRKTEGESIVTALYDERDADAVSPKFSLSWSPADWTLRYSMGRGVRFPTVSELFQGSQSGSTIVNNDPNLKAEDSIAHDLTWERGIGIHELRVSLFHDDIEDSIFQQTNINVTPNVTNIQNVDRVVTSGVELVYGAHDLLPGVDLDANIALSRSKIEENTNVPASEGKDWPRVPRVRGNLVVNWRFLPAWNANLSARHSGRQYNELNNSDTRSDVFGSASKFTTVDARVGYRFLERFEVAVGIENLTDEHYYIFHPYPGRTYLAEFRGAF